jgi:hypothetical protein
LKNIRIWPHTIGLLAGCFGILSAAYALDFSIDNVNEARSVNPAELKSGAIAFSDHTSADGIDSETALIAFTEWADKDPVGKKFLALYPSYSEPTVGKTVNGVTAQVVDKLYMYVAQARFIVDRAPEAIDLSHYVTLAFLQQIDPAITHSVITAADPSQFRPDAIAGNDNPDRKWCTGRTTSICIQSAYKFQGKIPMGIMLVNKLRDSVRKVADQIVFQSELSALAGADLDQAGLQQLTGLNSPVSGVLEQDIFYVNQIMKFGKLYAVFQADPADAGKTAVTAFMALAIKASVLDEKRGFEKLPVLRNLVPAQVLMGQSSFNSGDSLSAGLPKYARNEITTIAGILEQR